MDGSRKQLRRATIVFWILLVYIIAALLWWLVSLEQQNKTIHGLQKQEIVHQKGTKNYSAEWNRINHLERRNSVKYIAEGITFLALIIFGAVYIYRLVRRQFALQQQQQNFVMAVTHELKTPISVVRLNLETLQKHQLDEERRKKLMGITVQETMRLDTLINNILISSQLDVNAYKASKENLNFSELVLDVLHYFSLRYPDKMVQKKVQPEVDVKGDPLLLKLLVSNLVENAFKYAERTTPVTCSLSQTGAHIQLKVTDEGTGIKDEEKKKVFDKFYRTGSEQTRKTQGTGLGLYICKKIVQSHRGTISIKDNKPQGSTFIVTFKP